MARVLTVILNWRTPQMTLQAAEAALREMAGIEGAITIVDNDSGDGSFEALSRAVTAKGWDRGAVPVRVLQSGRNGGFVFGGFSRGEAALLRDLGRERARALVVHDRAMHLVRPGKGIGQHGSVQRGGVAGGIQGCQIVFGAGLVAAANAPVGTARQALVRQKYRLGGGRGLGQVGDNHGVPGQPLGAHLRAQRGVEGAGAVPGR